MARVLSIAKVRVRSDAERDYLDVMARLASCAAEREQRLWVFRHGGDPHTFVEFSESRGAAEHRSVRHHSPEEAALEARRLELVEPLPGGDDLWVEVPIGAGAQRQDA